MVLQVAFHDVFSHLTGGLEHVADSTKHSIESALHFSSKPKCDSTEVPALSAIPFVSDRWGSDVQ